MNIFGYKQGIQRSGRSIGTQICCLNRLSAGQCFARTRVLEKPPVSRTNVLKYRTHGLRKSACNCFHFTGCPSRVDRDKFGGRLDSRDSLRGGFAGRRSPQPGPGRGESHTLQLHRRKISGVHWGGCMVCVLVALCQIHSSSQSPFTLANFGYPGAIIVHCYFRRAAMVFGYLVFIWRGPAIAHPQFNHARLVGVGNGGADVI